MSIDNEWQCAWCGERAVTHIRVNANKRVRNRDGVTTVSGGTWRPACEYHRRVIRRLNDTMTPETVRRIKREIAREIWQPKQESLFNTEVGKAQSTPHYRKDVANGDVRNQ